MRKRKENVEKRAQTNNRLSAVFLSRLPFNKLVTPAKVLPGNGATASFKIVWRPLYLKLLVQPMPHHYLSFGKGFAGNDTDDDGSV